MQVLLGDAFDSLRDLGTSSLTLEELVCRPAGCSGSGASQALIAVESCGPAACQGVSRGLEAPQFHMWKL